MRAISLVERLEFDFSGNVVRSTVTLGDVDNDGRNELVVGNENGDLVILKVNISRNFFVLCYYLIYSRKKKSGRHLRTSVLSAALL